VAARFGDIFEVDRIAATPAPDRRKLIPGYAVYLMTLRVASRSEATP
jgi:hypothetical protein